MLLANVTFYASGTGGRIGPIIRNPFGCPCKLNPADPNAWDCRFTFHGSLPISLGSTRRAALEFLSGKEAEVVFEAAKRFYLWERGIIGEATIIGP
jgi:hypothetical protein